MNELLTKYFSGEISPDEKDSLFGAMQQDVDLKKDFVSILTLRALTDWLPRREDHSLAMVKLLSFKQALTPLQKHSLWGRFYSYAAVIMLAIGITWYMTNHRQVVTHPLTYEEVYTPAGQRMMLKMQDGTKVWLNACSTLKYPSQFDKEIRKVELRGEAYFEVAHNAKVPFVVSTPQVAIRVLGTKFNVFAYDKEFNIALVEGRVKVYDRKRGVNGAIYMLPNQTLSVVNGKFVRGLFDDSTDLLSWRDGIYSFDDTPFDVIARKLEIYYGITIIQHNKKLGKFRFSGKFRQRDGVTNVLRNLQKVYPFSFTINDDLAQITIH